MSNKIELAATMQAGGKAIIVYQTDVPNIYSVHHQNPLERAEMRLGFIAVLPIGDGVRPLWAAHGANEFVPPEPWLWGGKRYETAQEALEAVASGKAATIPQKSIQASQSHGNCTRCGAAIVMVTDTDGKTGAYEYASQEVVLDSGVKVEARQKHICKKK